MNIQVGGALGIAVLTAIYASAASPEEYWSGLPAAFAGGAIIALVGALLAWTVLRSPTAQKHE